MARNPLFYVCVITCVIPAAASAQGRDAPTNQPFNDSGISSDYNRAARARPKPVLAPITVNPDPWQRLDRGALLCDTEEDLQQHQAATAARLDGRSLPEPSACHIVRQMVSVSVLERHGPARTKVALPLPPGQKTQPIGWTDAAIPKDKPLRP